MGKQSKKIESHLTGTFTIHFDVDSDTHDLLSALARKSQTTPNDVASSIVLTWMRETEAQIIAARRAKESDGPRIIAP